MKEQKNKVGRPKLANNIHKKESIIMIEICIIAIIVLIFGAFNTIGNNLNKLKGWSNATSDKSVLDGKSVLMFGTSIGYGIKSDEPGSTAFINLIADKHHMSLTNYAHSGCGGVYEQKYIFKNGYFTGGKLKNGKVTKKYNLCKGVLALSKKEIQSYDYIIIEGFANDSENKRVKLSVFKKELRRVLKYLNKNKKKSTKLSIVATPKLPDGYSERQDDFWNAAERISERKKYKAYFCNTYYVNANYTYSSGDHPTQEGHNLMAEVVEECMEKAK